MKKSKMTSKYQATIPKEIRDALKLKAGDLLIFEVLPDNTVIVRKGFPFDVEYAKSLSSTLSEWDSENDDEAYRDL